MYCAPFSTRTAMGTRGDFNITSDDEPKTTSEIFSPRDMQLFKSSSTGNRNIHTFYTRGIYLSLLIVVN